MNRDPADFDRQFNVNVRRDLGRKTIRGGAMMMGANGIRFALETARIVFLARLLLPSDYGLVAMVTVFTGLISLLQDLGLGMATVTRDRITHAQVSTLFWLNVAIGLGLLLCTAASAPALAWFYGEPRVTAIALAIAPAFLISSASVQHQALLRRQMRFGALSAVGVLSVAGGLVVAVALAYLGAGYWALVGMTLAAATTQSVAVWAASRWRPGLPARGSGAREMIVFGGHITGTNVVNYFASRLDQLLLGWWWGPVTLGLYTKATSLEEVPVNRAMTPIASVVVPSLSRLVNEPERYRAAYLRIFEMMTLVAIPVSVFLVTTSPWLIPFLLGPKWVDAAPIFAALAVVGFLRPFSMSARWMLITQNRADEAFRWSLLGGFARAAAVGIGLPWGGIGVAISIAGWSLLRTPLMILYVGRSGPVPARDLYRAMAAPGLAAAATLLVLILLRPFAEGRPDALVVAVGLVVTAAVFVAVLSALPAGRRTLSDVWGILHTLRLQRGSLAARPDGNRG